MAIFLFTDIEGSTQLWERHSQEMTQALAEHDRIMREFIFEHGGRIIKHTGDGVFAIFPSGNPCSCAIAIQMQLKDVLIKPEKPLKVRMALHAGKALERGGDYFGPVINRTARLLAIAWGGQIIMSQECLSEVTIPDGVFPKDLGQHLLKDLSEPQLVIGIDHEDLPWREFPPLRSLSNHRHNLPVQPTAFYGRDSELKEISQLILSGSTRLVTLHGAGGMGKTRLALQVGAESIGKYPDGVFFVALATLSSAGQIPTAILQALEIPQQPGKQALETLIKWQEGHKALLILDNMEHLGDAQPVIEKLLEQCHSMTLLITSRTRLLLPEESTYEIGPFPAGNDRSEGSALRFFLQVAQRYQVNHEFTGDEVRCMEEICNLVGGLPLGIELAAPWVRVLPLTSLLEEIRRNLDFLNTDKNHEERHRSLRAVFNYSFSLLSPREVELLCGASVFAGSFDHLAAKGVLNASLGELMALLDRALIRKESSGRFTMHETIRQFASEYLAQNQQKQDELEKSHALHYAEQLSRFGQENSTALEKVLLNLGNLRKTWNWLLDKKFFAEIPNLALTVHRFAEERNRFDEGLSLFRLASRKLKESNAQETEAYARVRTSEGALLRRVGEMGLARDILITAAAASKKLNKPQIMAESLFQLGLAHESCGEFEAAESCCAKAEELQLELNNVSAVMSCKNARAQILYSLGLFDQAAQLAEQSAKYFISNNDIQGEGWSRVLQGQATYGAGRFDEGRELLRQARAAYRKFGDKAGVGWAADVGAELELDAGNVTEAERLALLSHHSHRESGASWGIAYSLRNLSRAHGRKGFKSDSQKERRESFSIALEKSIQPLLIRLCLDIAEDLQPDEPLLIDIIRSVLQHPACEARMKSRAEILIHKNSLQARINHNQNNRPLTIEEIGRECLHAIERTL